MLPKPAEGFDWIQMPAGPALVCRALASTARHFYTTRQWPSGSNAAPDRGALWSAVADAAGTPGRLLRLQQVHGADQIVHRIGSALPATPPRADIILSDDPLTAAAVQAADCVPLLVADTRSGAVAAAHAGWRGLAARVPIATVLAMARAFGSEPRDLIAAVGPSIGACCYEVGADVHARFMEAFGATDTARWFHKKPLALAGNPSTSGTDGGRPGRQFFDAWQAARDQLEAAGVRSDRIHVAALCTASHPDTLCSYRREGAAAGRIAAAIRSGGTGGLI
jgi:purine-nucleoside/S-methyl-5'-thioadenosine phosphorylase / adenosine deaminase